MKSKQFLIIIIITTITVVFWVASGIFQSRETKTVSEVEQLLETLNPSFDSDVINEL